MRHACVARLGWNCPVPIAPRDLMGPLALVAKTVEQGSGMGCPPASPPNLAPRWNGWRERSRVRDGFDQARYHQPCGQPDGLGEDQSREGSRNGVRRHQGSIDPGVSVLNFGDSESSKCVPARRASPAIHATILRSPYGRASRSAFGLARGFGIWKSKLGIDRDRRLRERRHHTPIQSHPRGLRSSRCQQTKSSPF